MDPALFPIITSLPVPPKNYAVCRLYKNSPSNQSWEYTSCWGGLFFLMESKDVPLLILVDISTKERLWECELYPDVNFEKLTKYFCAFEGDECIWGLSFAEKFDASQFSQTVKQWTQSKKAKKKKKGGFLKSISSSIKSFVGGDDTEKKKQNVTIGKVENFQRSMHIGFEPGKGFVYENLPAEWKKLFADAGIKKDDLQDKEKAKVLFKTMKKFEKKQGGAPPPPPPSKGGRSKPAPPPPRKPAKSSGGGAPPPPPPAGGPPPPPPPLSAEKLNSLTAGNAPPPQEGRQDLLAQIRAGTKLRKVEAPAKTKNVALDLNEMSAAGKNDLMSMLKQSLAKRADAMHSDSDDDSDWSDDDEDW